LWRSRHRRWLPERRENRSDRGADRRERDIWVRRVRFLAVNQVNGQAASVGDKTTVELIASDTRGDPKGQHSAEALAETDGVKFVFGPFLSMYSSPSNPAKQFNGKFLLMGGDAHP
jgi:hypothetical protein